MSYRAQGRGLCWKGEHKDSNSCQGNDSPARDCYQKWFSSTSTTQNVVSCSEDGNIRERRVTTVPHPEAFGLKYMSLSSETEPRSHSGRVGRQSRLFSKNRPEEGLADKMSRVYTYSLRLSCALFCVEGDLSILKMKKILTSDLGES